MKLTDTHLVLLSAAAQDEAHLLPRPDHLRGTAADALATKLIRAGLVEEVTTRSGQPHWRLEDDATVGLRITPTGLAAIGLVADEPSAPTLDREPDPQAGHAPRPGSKQAAVLDLVRREQGASLDELIGATGWLAHTTRAALTGLRQRGYDLIRSKGEDGRSVYRLSAESEAPVVSGEEG
jgi:Protein of unknown function (DUF3489)